MPTKPNKAGNQQNYVPSGNGDASGEYADDATGSNIHYFTNFKTPEGSVVNVSSKETTFNNIEDDFVEEQTNEDFNAIENDFTEDTQPPESFESLESDFVEEIGIDIQKEETHYSKAENYIKENEDAVNQLGAKEVKKILLNSYSEELDVDKVNELSNAQIKKLAVALNVLQNKESYLANVNKVGTDFLEKISNDEIIGKNNVWVNLPKDAESFETSLNGKIAYFSNVAENGTTEEIKKIASERLAKLNELVNSEELKQWKQAQQDLNFDFKKYQKLVDKYSNPDNLYSQKAKNEAKWFKTIGSSSQTFQPYADKVIKEWEAKDPQAIQMIKDYTGSYSSINYPLRSMDYPHKSSYPSQSKQKQKEFINRVEKMTKVIDTSTYDFNCWVQRGVGQLNVNGKMLKGSADQLELNNLVGTTFKDQGFMSCGSHKGGGFSDHDVIMNLYCPKGTKMLYAKSLSNYGSEDETIIQRGYSYKITKAEKKNGTIYLDCEVLLGSDENKYDTQKLTELAEKHF